MSPGLTRFKGCIIGSALGDAVGELAFKYPSKDKLFSHIDDLERLRYTDDTAMAIGLAESLIECGGEVDQQNIGDIFRKNYREEPWRGYGQGPPKIFNMVEENDIGYVEAANTLFQGEGSKGNGAAMRIAPVGTFFADDDNIYEKGVKTAEVTHAHKLGKDGAGILATAIGDASLSDNISPIKFVDKIAERAEAQEFTQALKQIKSLLQNEADREKAAKELGTSVLIEKSVPYAIFSFLKNPDSYEEALMNAILVSGDRDTIGAMAGAISGAFLGIEGLREKWVEKLEDLSYMKKLGEDLYELRRN